MRGSYGEGDLQYKAIKDIRPSPGLSTLGSLGPTSQSRRFPEKELGGLILDEFDHHSVIPTAGLNFFYGSLWIAGSCSQNAFNEAFKERFAPFSHVMHEFKKAQI